MKTIALSLLLLASPFFLPAQSLAGEYVLSSEEGEIVLQLQEDGQGRLAGSLKDTDGTLYRAQAAVQNEDAFGTFTNPQVGLYFEAYRQGGQLVLTIMPVDAYNQPDYLNAKEFMLSRREKAVSPIDFSRPPAEKRPESSELEGQQDPRLYGQWEGAYYGEINGTPSKLSLLQYGNQLSGEIDANGYKYGLEGTISGSRSQGDAWDPQVQLNMKFSGILSGNMALVTFTAAQGQFEMQFFREGTKPPSKVSADKLKPQQAVSLAGIWFYAKPNESGEFGSKKLGLLLKADGTFEYGDAGEVGKEPAGRVAKGQWGVQGNVLRIDQGKGWVQFGEYQPADGLLLRKSTNGSVERWERNREEAMPWPSPRVQPDPANFGDDPKTQQTASLAGSWFYIKPNESGEFGSKKLQLLLKADGTFEYGDAGEVGKEPAGRVGKGKWEVQGNVLRIDQGKGWVKFAEYQPGDEILLRKFSDGKVEQWGRY